MALRRTVAFALKVGLPLLVSQTVLGLSLGQSPVSSAPQSSSKASEAETFDVATIKPAAVRPDGVRFLSLNVYPNGRLAITNWTLKQLVCAAYGLSYWQVRGGPSWTETDLYDVEAKPADPTDGTHPYDLHHDNWSFEDPQLRAMLRTLLEDRFKLKTRLVVGSGSVYILQRSDRKLTLTPAAHTHNLKGSGGIGARPDGYRLLNTTMPQLAAYLSGYVFREAVIDKTGLIGAFDFQSKLALTDQDMPSVDPHSILPAIKEMGLEVTRGIGSVTTLQIDRASRPSEN